MTNQIDELMALADEYATAIATQGEAHDHVARDAFRTALEAALKPGEPVTWAEAEAIAIRPSVEDAIEVLLADQTLDNATGVVMAVLNAAPPAQTPPPRLTEEEMMQAIDETGVAYNVVTFYRAIETAVRKQAGWE